MRTLKVNEASRFCTKKKTCLSASVLMILALLIIFLILGLTVFKAKNAITTVNSVRLSGLSVGLDVPNLGVNLNLTLDMDLSVTNPNKASFKYGQGQAELYYRGDLVGEALIPPGEIMAGETIETNVTLTILANRLISDSNVYSDVLSGTLLMTTYTTIAGRVTILNLIKHHIVSYSTCSVTINVRTRTVANSDCKYRTKF